MRESLSRGLVGFLLFWKGMVMSAKSFGPWGKGYVFFSWG